MINEEYGERLLKILDRAIDCFDSGRVDKGKQRVRAVRADINYQVAINKHRRKVENIRAIRRGNKE